MGLLTNSSDSSRAPLRALRKLKKYSTAVCLILYLAGICYFAILNWQSFHGKTYFSENALLPGLVDEEFTKSKQLTAYSRAARQAMLGSNQKYFVPVSWLRQKFTEIGLESYTQNFTAVLPFAGIQKLEGQNVFGILRAPKGFSEAVVVAVPYRMDSYSALGLLFALAEFCREQIYWAKDLIFVIVEHESIGMEAWLSAYHHRFIPALQTESLLSRGGAIQAAVAVELANPQGPFTHTDIKFNMVNGQLPNLDLINLMVRMAEKEALEPSIFRQEDTWDVFSYSGYLRLLNTSVRGLLSQAFSRPTGLHGSFGGYGIEAVTLEAYHKGRTKADSHYVGIEEIARILEGSLRSLNNLLERFHQSYFFYVLPSVHSYISIGSYMPAIGLMLMAPLLKACCLWVEMSDDSDSDSNNKNYSLLSLTPLLLLAHLIGIFLYSVPYLLSNTENEEMLANGLFGIALAMFLFPHMLARKYEEKGNSAEPAPLFVRSVLLIMLALMLGVTSVLNFGLGFFLAVVAVPIALIVQGGVSRIHKLFSSFLLILTNPLVLTVLVNLILLYWNTGSAKLSLQSAVLRSYHLTKSYLIAIVVDCFVHGSWLFALMSLFFAPLWLLFWTLNRCF